MAVRQAPTHHKERSVASCIVVGVDGSTAGQRALAWALDEASQRAAELVVVHAWEYPTAFAFHLDGEQSGREVLTKALAGLDTRGVDVRPQLVEGHPVTALVRESLDADMLVVGSRGRSGISAAILGSVSTGCVHHAACPVVVIPAARVCEHGSEPQR
jgi:nucleotide-binding universal stress UspA family protein